ncbi:GTP pyrophosphokinase [Exiguobacterium alkaliphilum]|uniref:GTP pyrophosphokinase n=1 Tax=Exiguobacterium alkaliphilum TaxID=1428684 RepID=UPI001BAC825A|nr:GTP pyrophosphokinase family protein [Exiguobacterium alkaliphilum]QUE87618.1 GTP pyrophosphokinase family protein [Exiguobacterium alkaliphilum]
MEIEEFFGEQFHHWRERFRYYEMAITELESDLGIIDLDWQTRLGYSPIEHVKTRMKTLPSIVRKMKQKELPLEVDALWDHVHDVAGVRIVTSFRDDIYAILDHLKKRDDLQIDEVKDYIKHPKPSGYRSLHLIVRTKVYLAERVIWVPAEIQIRTLAMDFWAATEHKLQYKYQQQIPEASRHELTEAANMADALDTQMGRIREQILKK